MRSKGAYPLEPHAIHAAPSLVVCVLLALYTSDTMGQCTNSTAFGTVAAPTTTAPITISTCTYQSEYNTVTGIVAGQT